MTAYYNENNPVAAHTLRHLIADGVIAPGDVDDRSIKEVQPDDLRGYTQCHFFAGFGGWSLAARLAGWPDDRPLWTGSCPCQPFSVAGKGGGTADARHLWPDFFRLIRSGRPAVIVGEQVAGADGYRWFDGVAIDLEEDDYACRTVDIPACAVDAPHIRQRLYWCAVGNADGIGRAQAIGKPGDNKTQVGCGEAGGIECSHGRNGSYWSDYEWLPCHDGKARRAKSGIRLLVDGMPGRIGAWSLAGNGIVPPLAAEVLAALSDVLPEWRQA